MRTFRYRHSWRPRWAFSAKWCWLFGHRYFKVGTWREGPALLCLFSAHSPLWMPKWDAQ